jgi:non-specific serine/threonine protein kinase
MTARRLLGLGLTLALGAAACGGSTGHAASPGIPTTTASSPATTAADAAPTTGPPTTTALVQAAWRARTPAPTARQEVASAVFQGEVWVIGGLTTAGASSVVEAYDPAADRWSSEPSLPLAVHHAAATIYRGEIVVLGGFVDASSLYAQATDRAFAFRDGGWVELPKLRRPRGAAAAATVGNSLILVGGRDADALIGPTEVFDGTAWHDAQAIPTKRDHLAAVSDGKSVFAMGGRFIQPGATTSAVERYDPVANAWEGLPAMPSARAGLGATLVGGRILTAGGEDPTGTFGNVEAYDIAGARWSDVAPLPSPRHGLAFERVGDQVLALDGGTAYGVAPSKIAEALAPVG